MSTLEHEEAVLYAVQQLANRPRSLTAAELEHLAAIARELGLSLDDIVLDSSRAEVWETDIAMETNLTFAQVRAALDALAQKGRVYLSGIRIRSHDTAPGRSVVLIQG